MCQCVRTLVLLMGLVLATAGCGADEEPVRSPVTGTPANQTPDPEISKPDTPETDTPESGASTPEAKPVLLPKGRYRLHVEERALDDRTTEVTIRFGEGTQGKRFNFMGSDPSGGIGRSPVEQTKSLTIVRKFDPQHPQEVTVSAKATQALGETRILTAKVTIPAGVDPLKATSFPVTDGSDHPLHELITLFSAEGTFAGRSGVEFKIAVVLYDESEASTQFELGEAREIEAQN